MNSSNGSAQTMPEFMGVLSRLQMVPLITLQDAESARPLAKALSACGLPIAEVALRTSAAIEAIRTMVGGHGLLVGAGTVRSPDQADLAAAAGASFVVSPGYSAAVVDRCRDLGLPAIPGIATATELQTAWEAGLRLVKFFPAEQLGGVSTLRALAAVYPDVKFLPSGGIAAANLASYLGRPEVLAVSGSWLVPERAIRAGDFAAISRLAGEARAIASRQGAT